MGIFNEKYFPEVFFTTNLLDKLNPPDRTKYLDDKILATYFWGNLENQHIKVVKNYIYNSNGYFYDENGMMDYQKAVDKVKDIGEAVIKPSVDSNSGRNVNLLNIKNGIDINTNESINEILNKYNKNYMVQEKIKQHKDFAKLNPSSVNTIRINTYVCEGKIYSSPIAMRIGRDGSIVDNAHAGGMQIGVDENGNLREYAFTEFGQKFDKHPDNGIKFKGYKIPKINEMIKFTIKYHYKIPHIGIIAWDLTLDENENIVIIEANIGSPSVWFPQYVNGQAFFGNNTEKMIQKLKEKVKVE